MHFKPSHSVLVLLLLASCGSVPRTTVTELPVAPPLAAANDSLLARVLERAISSGGTISIKALQSDTDLSIYLQQLSRVHSDGFNSRLELLAYWINTHNAYVLDMIRLNPARSIDDISGFRFAKVIPTADGQRYSLDDIEHTILEHQFREPRAFFALFDGSRSSPTLLDEPYSGEHLSDQLDGQFRAFLADSTKNYLDRRANTLYLSKIFQDYSTSLEEMASEPLRTLVRDFAPPAISEWISRHSNVTISYLRYDDAINSSDYGYNNPSSNERKPPTTRRTSGGIR
jgi:hypothetical protein